MDPIILAVIAVLLLFTLLALGMPVAFAVTLVGFVGLISLLGFKGALSSLKIIPFGSVSTYILTAVPMFILMGQFAFHADIGHDVFDFGEKWLAGLPGGLACATVAGCAMFGAATGSSLACCATMGKIAIPEMEKAGYHPSIAAGAVTGAGGLAILIPPSIPSVLYASVSNESVSQMLIAGIVPGIVSAIIMIGFIVLQISRHPELAPRSRSWPWKMRLKVLKNVWGMILIFVTVMGSMYMGWATPTEAGAVGAFSVFMAVIIRRKATVREVWGACLETLRSLSMIFLIFIGTQIFGFFLNRAGVPMVAAEFVSSLSVPPIFIMILILLFLIPLGMFLDTNSIILLTTPIVYPVIISLGYSGVTYGLVLIIMCEIALITPPVAFNIYVVKGVAPQIPLVDIMKGSLSYIMRDSLVVVLLLMVPQIGLWLPGLMIK